MENLPEDYFVKINQFVKTTHRDVYPSIEPTLASNSQAGKVIVITGASRGMGRTGFVASFAKAGPKGIVLVARSAESLEVVAKEVKAINEDIQILAVPTELKNADSIASLWSKVKETFGQADVLVNNAATAYTGPLADAAIDDWWGDFETNVRGNFLLAQGFMKLLGKEQKGTIINIVSAAAYLVNPGMSSYSIAKLALLQLSTFISAENPNIKAIAVHPGIIMTDMTLDIFKKFAKDTPELVGGLAVWLATDKSDFLRGKYMESNWSVDDLVERKEEILGGKLSIAVKGDFGSQQFE